MFCIKVSQRPVTHYSMFCIKVSQRKNYTNCSFVSKFLNGQFYLPIECTMRQCVTNGKKNVSLLGRSFLMKFSIQTVSRFYFMNLF